MWGLVPIVVLVIHQTVILVRQGRDRAAKFDQALDARQRSQKPLLVVGGPYGSQATGQWLNIAAHPHGDVCLDLEWRSCREDHFVEGDVRDIPFPDKSFGAVFCSHVLEHLPNAEDVYRAASELHRVADAVFICLPERAGLINWLAPEHAIWVREDGGNVIGVEPNGVRWIT